MTEMTRDQLNKAIETSIFRLEYLRDRREQLQLDIYSEELLQKQLIKMKKNWIDTGEIKDE